MAIISEQTPKVSVALYFTIRETKDDLGEVDFHKSKVVWPDGCEVNCEKNEDDKDWSPVNAVSLFTKYIWLLAKYKLCPEIDCTSHVFQTSIKTGLNNLISINHRGNLPAIKVFGGSVDRDRKPALRKGWLPRLFNRSVTGCCSGEFDTEIIDRESICILVSKHPDSEEFDVANEKQLTALVNYWECNLDRNLQSELLHLPQFYNRSTLMSSLNSRGSYSSTAADCLFLILLDRFEEGLWGHSLSSTAASYGHKSDPGSITVSCWVLEVLSQFGLSQVDKESSEFLKYLRSRRSANGAVGMQKEVGSSYLEATVIVEHRRHTAMAAQFFLLNGCLPEALACAKYLIESQDSEGAWSDVAMSNELPSDPVTTAFVLRVLIDFENQGLLDQLGLSCTNIFLASYKLRGIYWLIDNLNRHDGLWVYERSKMPMERAYTHTCEILSVLPEIAEYDKEGKIPELLAGLLNIWDKCKGLPTGPMESAPSLDASMHFLSAVDRLGIFGPEKVDLLLEPLLDGIDDFLYENDSTSVGWHILARLLLTQQIVVDLCEVREQATKFRLHSSNHGVEYALEAISHKPKWVQEILRKRILSNSMLPK